ncbi:hypothetical protein CCH79_00016845 [Gambusia affinis]|uniref:COMM domain-containing protein n=1 Tax=Gambusia affinis TaxID=33528 RepID=A0A315UX01_GAMAF|nr:hypothetical protein CCH79_00016845 [Gambusia affinis]
MLLVLSEDHKEHLSFLTKTDGSGKNSLRLLRVEVVEEFGRIALDFLRKGTNPKIYEGAARGKADRSSLPAGKLCVPVEMVQHGVEGLMFLMTESSKHMISEVDFMDSVLALGFGEELNQSLLQLYVQHKHQVRSILSQLLCNQPAYHNLEWRLDVQLASRSVRHQIVPMVTIRLLLTRSSDVGSTKSCMDLQTDPISLLHMISTLEAALAAVKTTQAIIHRDLPKHQSGEGYKRISKHLNNTVKTNIIKWRKYGTTVTLQRTGCLPKIDEKKSGQGGWQEANSNTEELQEFL